MTASISFLCALFFAGSLLGPPGGLGGSPEKGWGVPSQPQNCEMNLQNLEYLRNLVKARTEEKGFLIIVARLGKGEKQPVLNDRRLYNVRLKLTLIDVPENRIIAAQGERVNGFGRIEFYWQGELVGALLVHKGRDICVGCCGPDQRFYPYRRNKSGIKRNHATHS